MSPAAAAERAGGGVADACVGMVVVDADDGVEACTFVRWTSGRSAAAGGVQAPAFVSDRAGAEAAAPSATTDNWRMGSGAFAGDGSATVAAGSFAAGCDVGAGGDTGVDVVVGVVATAV